MMFKLLLDVMDRFLNLRDTNAECAIALLPSKVSEVWKSDRTLRDGSFGGVLSQALRARLQSHRPSGTSRNKLILDLEIERLHRFQPTDSFSGRSRTMKRPF
jgi:hypothetical protein